MNSEAIIIGVVTGIISGLLLNAFANIIRTIIVPWYQAIVYTGVNIAGEWSYSITTPSGTYNEVIVQIKQKATKIECIATKAQKIKINEKTRIKIFKLSGNIRDRLVVLTGESLNQNELGKNAYLFEVVEGGQALKGIGSWYSITHNNIQSSEIIWRRTNS